MKKPLNPKSVERMRERERTVGVDPDDEAARWLDENDPKPEPPQSKSAFKSKALHRWRKQQS